MRSSRRPRNFQRDDSPSRTRSSVLEERRPRALRYGTRAPRHPPRYRCPPRCRRSPHPTSPAAVSRTRYPARRKYVGEILVHDAGCSPRAPSADCRWITLRDLDLAREPRSELRGPSRGRERLARPRRELIARGSRESAGLAAPAPPRSPKPRRHPRSDRRSSSFSAPPSSRALPLFGSPFLLENQRTSSLRRANRLGASSGTREHPPALPHPPPRQTARKAARQKTLKRSILGLHRSALSWWSWSNPTSPSRDGAPDSSGSERDSGS